MRHLVLATALLTATAGAPTQPNNWADKMFKDGTAHDFGNVPRGAQLFHSFPMTNIYAVPLQVLDVRTSCGCITATPSKRVLQPRETGSIDVTMDARRFTGAKAVRVNITVGPDYTSTAELKIAATSRPDVVFNPGQVTFGVVNRGDTPTQAIDVEYAGSLDWRVQGVQCSGPFTATLQELYRKRGQVGYQVKVTLAREAPVGQLKQELHLQTNDPASPLVPVLVEATVQAPLAISPDPLKIPNLKSGQEELRKVVVRGSKPFRLLKVEGEGDGVTVATPLPSRPAPYHIVEIKVQPIAEGELRRELRIKTDLQDAPATLIVEGTASPP